MMATTNTPLQELKNLERGRGRDTTLVHGTAGLRTQDIATSCVRRPVREHLSDIKILRATYMHEHDVCVRVWCVCVACVVRVCCVCVYARWETRSGSRNTVLSAAASVLWLPAMWILRNKRKYRRPNLPISNDTRALRVSPRKCLLVLCTLILGARQVCLRAPIAVRQSSYGQLRNNLSRRK